MLAVRKGEKYVVEINVIRHVLASLFHFRITYLNQIAIDNPFNMGSCKNIYVFFCYCKPFDWHAVYDLKVSKTQFSGTHNKNCSANDEEEEEVRNDTHL